MDASLRAESALRQLHARYIDATWRRDLDTFRDCFTADGEWEIAGMHLCGREEIGDGFARLTAISSRVLMTLSLLQLEIDGDSATGRVRVTETIKFADGGAMRTIGSYRDRYVCEEGIWRFRHRRWQRHYRGAMDLSGPLDE